MKKPTNNASTDSKKTKEYTEVKNFKVKRCVMLSNGHVTLDVEINGVTIYGCFIVEGKNGDFISFPQRRGTDGKYYYIAYVSMSQDDTAAIVAEAERLLNGN